MPADNDFTAIHTIGEATISLRTPRVSDAIHMHRIVCESNVLDTNSLYSYLLLCRDFYKTCLVAQRDDDIIGFVTAYRPPEQPSSVFVWQIGVHASARRMGIAKVLLKTLVALPACRHADFLEATVTPSNDASRRLFQAVARELGVPFAEGAGLPATLFGTAGHEAENLVRIGPWSASHLEQSH